MVMRVLVVYTSFLLPETTPNVFEVVFFGPNVWFDQPLNPQIKTNLVHVDAEE